MKTWAKWTLGVVGGLVLLGLVFGSGTEDDGASESTGPNVGNDGSPSADSGGGDTAPPETTERCAGEEYCITLSNVQHERKDCLSEFSCAENGTEFLLITMTVKNEGTEDMDVNPYKFKLYTEDKVVSDASGYTYTEDGGMKSVTLRPGGETTGTLYYEVKKGVAAEEVCYEQTVIFGDNLRFCHAFPDGAL